jgi:saccharopepsin
MGIQAKSHMEQVFKAPYIADGTHPVPVSNFLNAQCKLRSCAIRRGSS